MGALLVYMLKAGFCLTVFYLFYKWLLSKETYHRFNRLTLLGIVLLSLLLPFCKFNVAHHTEVQQTIFSMEQLLLQYGIEEAQTTDLPVSTTFQWMHWLLLIYIIGILFVFGKHFYSLFQIIRVIKKGKREQIQGGSILVTYPQTIIPFSWMHYIVISEEDLQENREAILAHEMAHIRNKHSIDLLFMDVFLLFQWFNPAAWLLRQELQSIHEYEADEFVVEQGIDVKNYQLLLIKKAVGTRLYSMANSFNHSKLKKRITMMLKERSSSWARLKYLYILPLAAVTVSAFARPEVSNKLEELSSVKVTELIPETKSIQQPDSTAGEILIVDGVLQLGTTKLDYREDEHGKTYLFLKSVENPKEETKSTQEPDSSVTTVDKPVKVIEVGRSNGTSITILNSSDENDSIKVRGVNLDDPEKPPLLIVNGKYYPLLEGKYTTCDEHDPNIIEGVLVPDVSSLVEMSARMAAIRIPARLDNSDEPVLDLGVSRITDGKISVRGIDSNDPEKSPLLIVDDEKIPIDQLKKIDLNTIKSFTILKEPSLIDAYGEEGKNGVILITTKIIHGVYTTCD